MRWRGVIVEAILCDNYAVGSNADRSGEAVHATDAPRPLGSPQDERTAAEAGWVFS